MPDGTLHALTSTAEPVNLKICRCKEKLHLAVCPLSEYDIILGKKWHEDFEVQKNYRKNEVTFRKGIKPISICATLDQSKTLISKHKLAKHFRRGQSAYAIFLRPSNSSEALEINYTDVQPSSDDPRLRMLLAEFLDVFPDDLPTGLPPERKQRFKIDLEDDAEPHKKGIYRLSDSECEELLRQIRDLLDKGFIQPSTSPWGAPVLFAANEDGGLRLCIDYRALNKQTIKNCYPLPRIDNIFDNLRSAKVFTTLDLRSGYHQIRMEPESIPLTAFRTRDGLFEFLVLPFGLCNAPSAFMNLINDVLRPYINRFVCAYLDDILIYSKSLEEHLVHLRKVLTTLREHKLYAKLYKCEFCRASVDFLGHVVSPNGFQMEHTKTESIRMWSTPKTKKDVQSFLGLVNFYWRFIRGMADIVKPLTELTGKTDFAWTQAHENSFRTLKERVASAPVLRPVDPDLPVIVSTDASGCAIGAVLEQDDGMGRRPVAFFPQTLNIHEQRFTVRERELLAIVEAIRHWRCYLHGRSFDVHTDQESLRYLRTQDKLNDRQVRWLEMLEQYDSRITPVPGPKNVGSGCPLEEGRECRTSNRG